MQIEGFSQPNFDTSADQRTINYTLDFQCQEYGYNMSFGFIKDNRSYKMNFINRDYIKENAIIIDVGINRTENGLTGDVDFKSCFDKAGYITPVPGGVGPMTIAMLMNNCYEAALNRIGE